MAAAVDLAPLFVHAFHQAEAMRANEALAEARTRFPAEGARGAFSYEVVVPTEPDADWLESKVVAKLVYHCESTRAPLPECRGVFVSFFAGERLFCVGAAQVVKFAAEVLSKSPQELVALYGTGELREPMPRKTNGGTGPETPVDDS